MTRPSTLHQLVLFLTAADEDELAETLLSHVPELRFVDSADQDSTSRPPFRTSFRECAGRHVTVVDTRLVSQDRFYDQYVVPHPAGRHWIYAMVGTGLVNLLRSVPTDGGLLNGELRASVPRDDEATSAVVAEILRVARSGGARVVPIDAETGQVGSRVDRKIIAWPDAARRFDGGASGVLVNSETARFVARQPRRPGATTP